MKGTVKNLLINQGSNIAHNLIFNPITMTKISSRENQLLIEQFLTQNFDIRHNELNKRVEYREAGSKTPFLPLSPQVENSMVRRIIAELEEVKSVKSTVHDYIYSKDIDSHNPIRDYLNNLPEWDGKNRISEFFSRIPGITTDLLYYLSIWFRSAIAHWLGMDNLHGNESVPVLIGEQGDGKTTYWKALLPPELRIYFLDHLNLGNKFDKEMALTNNLIVNLDEMDKIKPAQQADLKYTLSVSQVNSRPIYGQIQEVRDRYASFVATTNDSHPLHDPTGSRRFICINLPKGHLIDYDSPIDYKQLYAQVYNEVVNQGMRYWFTTEESKAIQLHNKQYESSLELTDMIQCIYRRPAHDEEVKPIPIKDIIKTIKSEFPDLEQSHSLNVKIGFELSELGFEKKKSNQGIVVYAVRRDVA